MSLPAERKRKMKNNQCGICLSAKTEFIDKNENYLFCGNCGTVFFLKHSNPAYSDTYFTTDYLKQYGRTYADDFQTIYSFSLKRLRRIKKALSKSPLDSNLLEIGCALGFFLKAASDEGYKKCDGVEISKFASDYASEHYNFKVENVPFGSFYSSEKYDVVCGWYYFEHEKNVPAVLQKAASFLDLKGVLAFSIPSTNGPLFRFNREKWIETHPVDHSMDFSPKSVKMLLKKAGFNKVYIYPAGIHADRVFTKTLIYFPAVSFFYKLYSHIFKFSDTIEIYAVKK